MFASKIVENFNEKIALFQLIYPSNCAVMVWNLENGHFEGAIEGLGCGKRGHHGVVDGTV